MVIAVYHSVWNQSYSFRDTILHPRGTRLYNDSTGYWSPPLMAFTHLLHYECQSFLKGKLPLPWEKMQKSTLMNDLLWIILPHNHEELDPLYFATGPSHKHEKWRPMLL